MKPITLYASVELYPDPDEPGGDWERLVAVFEDRESAQRVLDALEFENILMSTYRIREVDDNTLTRTNVIEVRRKT